jgi:hypothetical protein
MISDNEQGFVAYSLYRSPKAAREAFEHIIAEARPKPVGLASAS